MEEQSAWDNLAQAARHVAFSGTARAAHLKEMAQALAQIDELDAGVWKATAPSERLALLQRIETVLAMHQGREPAKVVSTKLRAFSGSYNPTSRSVFVAERYLTKKRHPRRVVNTLVHEDRHALQDAALRGDLAHVDGPAPRSWRLNDRHYFRPPGGKETALGLATEIGSLAAVILPVAVPVMVVALAVGLGAGALVAGRSLLYRVQPWELDAFASGDRVARKLYPRSAQMRRVAVRAGVALGSAAEALRQELTSPGGGRAL